VIVEAVKTSACCCASLLATSLLFFNTKRNLVRCHGVRFECAIIGYLIYSFLECW
jgi:hypothetical protein